MKYFNFYFETADSKNFDLSIKGQSSKTETREINSLKRHVKHYRQRKNYYKKKLEAVEKELQKLKEKAVEYELINKRFSKIDAEFTSSETCEFCYGPKYSPKTAKLNCGCSCCTDCFLDRSDRLDSGRCNGCLVDIKSSLSGSIYRA